MHLCRISLVSIAALSHATQAQSTPSAVRGVDPQLAAKYVSNSKGTFVCLDGSAEIPFGRVNDDYCDCPDGSDEPGTSACNNGSFYCQNHGHIPARIPSLRVNDGVCDPQCCDGSDEWETGLCADVCEDVGRQHRQKMDAQRGAETRGARRRAELAEEAQGMRLGKEREWAEKTEALKRVEAELSAAETEKLALEESQRVVAESRRESQRQALYDEHLPELVALRRHVSAELHRWRAHRDSLVLLLRSVRASHNPEFNDQAVAQAISAYAEFVDTHSDAESAALAHANEDAADRHERERLIDEGGSKQDDVDYEACRKALDSLESERRAVEDDVSTLVALLEELRAGYNKNYHDLAVKAAVGGLGELELVREKDLAELATLAENVGIDGVRMRAAEAQSKIAAVLSDSEGNGDGDGDGDGESAQEADGESLDQQVADARTLFWDLQSEKNTLSSAVSNLRELLDKDLGPGDIYLPLNDKCFSLDAGEYTYEVCLLDRATQISNKDKSRQSLGSFSGFGELSATGEDYAVHKYLQGTKCWNGPHRSLTASFTCAEEIAVLAVTEPEKCEYHARMTGPFACPVDDQDTGLEQAQEQKAKGIPPMTDAAEGQTTGAAARHDEL
ncbi:glucosidase II beta subunit-like-domain-containing protein [Kickxella alabastrina]|uniref:glucosidase II beta subunit-like-domain-containing protein n=1 Tax=Kickxella alabastrina TaxID=61397 RepID=UPI002220ED8C|nr:glucosidase II beta subunit-like-domain-containing protein [Kickxella alabastrina]KAI7833984.1 glucosidase II beta subunit-like-domain-containing protein [Kickxella alabastrina]